MAESGQLPTVAKEVVACAVVMVALAAFAVGLRVYTRMCLLRTVGKDDVCIIIAVLFSIGNSVGMCLQATTALGVHIRDLSPESLMMFLKEVYFTIISYNIGIAFSKLSIMFLYFRLFTSTETRMRRISYAVLVIVVLVSLWSIFSSILFCMPVVSFWDKSVPGKCLPREPRWYTGAGLNILTDFMILVLPLPSITSLQLPRRQKVAVTFVFAIGFFVCVVSILRLDSLVTAAKSTDPTGDNPGVAKWSTIEINTAIICPCIATLRPLVSRMFPRLLDTLNKSSGPSRINTISTGTHHISTRVSHAKSMLPRQGANQTIVVPARGSTEEILEQRVEWNSLDDLDGKSGAGSSVRMLDSGRE